MREVLNRTLLVGDLVYLCSSDIMAIVIGSKKFYTERGVRQAYSDERIVKVDVVDEEAINIKNKLDNLYKKRMEDKLYVKKKVQKPGDVFRITNMGNEYCILYLGMGKKIYEIDSENKSTIFSNKKVYLKVRLFSKSKEWIDNILSTKEFYVDNTVINSVDFLYSVRSLTSFDKYLTTINVDNLPQSIKSFGYNTQTVVYF